jgi:hypothetical protein
VGMLHLDRLESWSCCGRGYGELGLGLQRGSFVVVLCLSWDQFLYDCGGNLLGLRCCKVCVVLKAASY